MIASMTVVSHEVVELGRGHYQLRVVSRLDATTWAHTVRAESADDAILLLRDLPLRQPLWEQLDR